MIAAKAVAAPAAKTAPAPKAPPAPKEEEPPGEIAGLPITRPDGRFLGLQIVNNNFVLTFYDAKKHKLPADAVRATLRWSVRYQPNDERVVLNGGADESVLTSAKTVRPPHVFKVYLGLFTGEGDAALESYVIDYHD